MVKKFDKKTKKKTVYGKKKTLKLRRKYNYGIKNEKDILVNKEGPLILTAPHTIFVKRINTIHNPENFVKKLVLNISYNLGKRTSTILWNIKANINDIKYNDPNYIPKKKLQKNEWYIKLDKLIKDLKKIYKKRILLIDFHGMKNIYGYDFIFGLNAIKINLGQEKYEKTLGCLMDSFNKFELKYKIKIGYNIIFTGYGKKTIYTISQIATLNNIFGLQIEMSDKFRKKLLKKKIKN